MGALLGREDRAREVVAGYEAELARLAAEARGLPRRRAAFYYANSYTSGGGTLPDHILDRAVLDNVARERGLTGPVRMPLEVLVMERPFLVRTTHISGHGPALAYAALDHPALRAVAAEAGSALLEERWDVCGTPFVTHAIRRADRRAADGRAIPLRARGAGRTDRSRAARINDGFQFR